MMVLLFPIFKFMSKSIILMGQNNKEEIPSNLVCFIKTLQVSVLVSVFIDKYFQEDIRMQNT